MISVNNIVIQVHKKAQSLKLLINAFWVQSRNNWNRRLYEVCQMFRKNRNQRMLPSEREDQIQKGLSN